MATKTAGTSDKAAGTGGKKKQKCAKSSKRRTPVERAVAEARTKARKDRNVARSTHGLCTSVADAKAYASLPPEARAIRKAEFRAVQKGLA